MNAPVVVENVTLRIGEAIVTVPGELAAKAYLEKLLEQSRPIPLDLSAPQVVPAIGAPYRGGIFAGLTIEANEVYELVLLPGENESCTWKEALAWVEQLDGVLPSRFDQLVLFKNLKSEFKEAWYWSGEQHAGYEDCAWCQGFSDGGQYWGPVSSGCRARAVRRLAIQ